MFNILSKRWREGASLYLNSENRFELRNKQRVSPSELLGEVCQYQELNAKLCFCMAGNKNVVIDKMFLFFTFLSYFPTKRIDIQLSANYIIAMLTTVLAKKQTSYINIKDHWAMDAEKKPPLSSLPFATRGESTEPRKACD